MKTLSKLQQLSFVIRREFLAISTSYAVLLVLMGGIFMYGLLYNYMYAPNICLLYTSYTQVLQTTDRIGYC